MNHRRVFLAIAFGVICAPRRLFAQHKTKRIGLLWIKAEGQSSAYLNAFRDGLRTHGYVEGKGIEIDDRFLVDRYPLLLEAAAKLVAEKVDIILCYGGTATNAARQATTIIPIVSITGTDPVAAGYAESLARPGKNISGIAMVAGELGPKRLELLKQVVPNLRVVGVPLNPESVRETIGFKELEGKARQLNLELRLVAVRIPRELDSAVQDAAKLGVSAFAPMPSTMFAANAQMVVSAIEKTRLPAIYVGDDFARVGGLLSYGPSYIESFRHAAAFVDKIFKGAKPADLPFEQPTKFELVINLKTAKALGITIPQSLLLRADEVIQ